MLQGKAFSGVKELATLISQDPRLAGCFTKQLLTYAVGRSFNTETGRATADALVQNAAAAGHQGVLDLIGAVIQSDAFRTHRGE